MGLIKGDTRSLDYSSNVARPHPPILHIPSGRRYMLGVILREVERSMHSLRVQVHSNRTCHKICITTISKCHKANT